MKRLLLPILLCVTGLTGGVAAGIAFRPAAVDEEPSPPPPALRDYARLNNQFVVPVIRQGETRALIVLSLSVEVPQGRSDVVHRYEPKLRDALLQVLFDHANTGGFDGAFTEGGPMIALRAGLGEAARGIVGPDALDVLVTDIVRQDSR
ncbi:flagellar basal body-associated protein FliL [Haematobacter missouriensis]|uniref:Flagellar basal body-associated protein FliL n=1 Tax=Haematobacter missouriensis TaxID=366616 RepID=A0A212ARX8_9RHOB|nr:flagellar basal body-associated FliL family protein [Haematobacter missouriensis]KFI33788.1 flagellar basal body-associated protein FliL [Haematobacter missouriensis]OWJ77718.1 flagellar basal body-associated protein FliL [Haematobacter missouriensis]OWJ84195.1 flagellar basal body-associated protein FliL [Haematobacter missouriensis]